LRGYIQKAETLIEALPYIREFAGKTVVVKYGGAAMKDEARIASFAEDIVLLQFVGIRPVIVHGGGPQIDRLLERLSIPTERRAGLRVTTPEAMEVVEMVLGGIVNKQITALINRFGGRAVGLSGKDASLIRACRYDLPDAEGKPLDLGEVGLVESVDVSVISTLEGGGFMPVIAPIGVGPEGQAYNINGDTAAAGIAGALKAEKFILLTDVPGVLDGNKELVSTMTESAARAMIAEGIIHGGMIPKVECGLDALADGVNKVHIIDGRVPHSVLLEIFTDAGIGTEITRS
jgi:acetylglutamate kinase